MLLLIAESITANLQQVAILQHAVLHGLPSPKHRTHSMKHHSRTADVDHGVAWKYLRIFEEIDVRLLAAPNIRLCLIKDELFPPERAGDHAGVPTYSSGSLRVASVFSPLPSAFADIKAD